MKGICNYLTFPGRPSLKWVLDNSMRIQDSWPDIAHIGVESWGDLVEFLTEQPRNKKYYLEAEYWFLLGKRCLQGSIFSFLSNYICAYLINLLFSFRFFHLATLFNIRIFGFSVFLFPGVMNMLIVVLFVTVTFPLSRYAFAPLLSADTDSVSFVFVRLSFRRATSSYLVLFAKKTLWQFH